MGSPVALGQCGTLQVNCARNTQGEAIAGHIWEYVESQCGREASGVICAKTPNAIMPIIAHVNAMLGLSCIGQDRGSADGLKHKVVSNE